MDFTYASLCVYYVLGLDVDGCDVDSIRLDLILLDYSEIVCSRVGNAVAEGRIAPYAAILKNIFIRIIEPLVNRNVQAFLYAAFASLSVNVICGCLYCSASAIRTEIIPVRKCLTAYRAACVTAKLL